MTDTTFRLPDDLRRRIFDTSCRAYWVDRTQGFLAGCFPGDQYPQWQRAKLRRLLIDAKISVFVDFMQDGERNAAGQVFKPYIEHAQALALGRPAVLFPEYIRCPVVDGDVPTTGEMICVLDIVDARLAAGRYVYLHCRGGIGRTGTAVACWLIRRGIVPDADSAFAFIQECRAGLPDPLPRYPSPENERQRDFVRAWRRGL